MAAIDLVITRSREGADAVVLSDSFAIQKVEISKGSDNTNSKADITFVNPNAEIINSASTDSRQWEDNIQLDDVITIAASFNALNSASLTINDKLFTGVVTKFSGKLDGSTSTITATCTDLTDIILAKAHVAKYSQSDSSLNNAHEIVENLVQVANDNTNGYDTVKTPNATGGRPTGGFIQNTTKTIDYFSNYKSVAQHIKAISVPAFTGLSRTCTYFIDDNREFYWFSPPDVGSTTLTSSISASALSIPVASTTNLSNAGGLITIEGEIIRYSGISGSNLTVASTNDRGLFDSIAATHASGKTVSNNAVIKVPNNDGLGISDVLNFDFDYDSEDVVNMVIMRLGKDKLRKNVTWYKYNDQTTTSKIRMKVFDFKGAIAEEYYNSKIGGTALVAADFTGGTTGTLTLDSSAATFTTGSGGSPGYLRVLSDDAPEILEYTAGPVASGSNYTFTISGRGKFNSRTIQDILTNTSVQDFTTIANTSNTNVRDGIRDRGQEWAEAYFAGQKEKMGMKVTLKGVKVNPGEAFALVVNDLGLNNIAVRVKDVRHAITKNSWQTTLTLEEDDSAIA
jgi:hypothetical protein